MSSREPRGDIYPSSLSSLLSFPNREFAIEGKIRAQFSNNEYMKCYMWWYEVDDTCQEVTFNRYLIVIHSSITIHENENNVVSNTVTIPRKC